MSEKVTDNITRDLIAPGIYRYISKVPKIGWTIDRRSGFWTCFGIDLMIPLGVRDEKGKLKRKRHRQKPIATKDAAEKILAKIKLNQHEDFYDIILTNRAKISVEALFDAVLPTIDSPREKLSVLRVQKHFLSILSPYYLVSEITTSDTFNYCEKRRKEGASAGTALREITTLSAILHKAPLLFKELKDYRCPKIYRPDDSGNARERVFSTDERERLLNYLLHDKKYKKENDKNFIARRRTGLTIYFALMTSLRHGDVCQVLKTWWDKSADQLKVKHGKTENFTIYNPVPETFKEILIDAERLLPNSAYFFSAQGKIHNKTYQLIRRACDEKHLNLPYGKNVADGFIIHDARKTTITTLQHNQIDSRTTQGISGHKRPQMVNYYTVAGTKARKDATDIIERELSLNGKKKPAPEILVENIYKKIRSGEMSLEEFALFFAQNR